MGLQPLFLKRQSAGGPSALIPRRVNIFVGLVCFWAHSSISAWGMLNRPWEVATTLTVLDPCTGNRATIEVPASHQGRERPDTK